MVDGGTSCTATRLTGSSASLCRNALLAAMLSPKLETEKAHKEAALTQKKKHPSNTGLTAATGSLGGAWLQATGTVPSGHALGGGTSGPVRGESQSSGPEPFTQGKCLSASLRVCECV